MSDIQIGIMGLVVLFACLAMRVPVAVSLGLVSFGGIALIRDFDSAVSAMGSMPFDFAANWTLSAIPMFLLMGAVAFHSGMTSSLFSVASKLLRKLPGGLAIATNVAAATFASVSGSSVATTAAMGRMAIPEMLKLNYHPGLATGVVAASGTLGALIPPSLAFIVYGWYAGVPIDKLFIAGILPAGVTMLVYATMIITRCMANPEVAPRPTKEDTQADDGASFKDIWPVPFLIFAIIGAIYTGITTPTEAAAAGAALIIIITVLKRTLNVKLFKESLIEATVTTASLFFIIIGAVLLTKFLTLSGLPKLVADTITAFELNQLVVILLMTVIFITLGMFLEPIGVMLITLPILLPICRSLDMDLIWFGVLVVKYIEIGLLTPPVGLHAFVVKSTVGDTIALPTIFKGLAWFLAAEIVIMVLLISFPGISTFLPSLMG